MAEDDDISRRYRELPREEPPRHLDDAIRAAARRAAHTRPAPLVVPTGRQRWYFPLAAAAIIVLAVAVTMHVEREQPTEELVTAPAPPAAPAASPPAPREMMREEAQAEEPKPEKPQSAPQPERRRKTESADSRELRDAAPPPELQAAQDAIRAQESAAGAFMGSAEPAPKASSSSAARLQRPDEAARQSSALAKLAVAPSPEQWLQGIADLRRQARHEEADKALAEFRKRYPGYKIPAAMLEKVEKR